MQLNATHERCHPRCRKNSNVLYYVLLCYYYTTTYIHAPNTQLFLLKPKKTADYFILLFFRRIHRNELNFLRKDSNGVDQSLLAKKVCEMPSKR